MGKDVVILKDFDVKTYNFEQLYEIKEDFFSDIFHYGKNIKCGSGHDDQIVSGWLRVFYGDTLKYPPIKDFDKYLSHTNYVCTKDIDENKMYCQMVSLAYSILDTDKNILIPGYGIVTYEITNELVYNKLAMITEKSETINDISINKNNLDYEDKIFTIYGYRSKKSQNTICIIS